MTAQEKIAKRLSLPEKGDVVLIDVSNSQGIDPARNIFLMDRAGHVIWQVEAAVLSHGVKGFSDISIGLDGGLLA